MNSITLTSPKKLPRHTIDSLQTVVSHLDDFEDVLLGFHMQKTAKDSTIPLSEFLQTV